MADVRLGAEHVRALQAHCNVDLHRVIAAGHSAGGQLALWLAAQRALDLRRVVGLAAVSDLRSAWSLKLSDGVVAQYLGGTPEQAPERYALSSPIELVPIGIPQRLLHGTADDTVPYDMSRRFTRASKNALLVTIEGAGHFDVIDPRSRAWPVVQKNLAELEFD